MGYAKENKKGSPTSIRFNDEKTAAALELSGKVSKQQLVDFLIDRYLNGENPILERKEAEVVKPQPKGKTELSNFWKERMKKKLGI